MSHAQLMHDKGRSMQELKRRLWLQELLEEVHTAEERAPPPPPTHGGGASSPDFSGNDLRQKPPEATKDLPHRFGPEREGPVLPQETHKASAYKDQPLKVATKRKKKARLGRRREGDKKRRRSRSAPNSRLTSDPGGPGVTSETRRGPRFQRFPSCRPSRPRPDSPAVSER